MPVVLSPKFGVTQNRVSDPNQTHECRRRGVAGKIGVALNGLLAIDVSAIHFFKSRVDRDSQSVVQVDCAFQQPRQDTFAELFKRISLVAAVFVVTSAFSNFSVVLGSLFGVSQRFPCSVDEWHHPLSVRRCVAVWVPLHCDASIGPPNFVRSRVVRNA